MESDSRCEFLSKNPSVCIHSMFYKPLSEPKSSFLQEMGSDEYNEKWKLFIRSRETFNCIGRMDGFYASRWCNGRRWPRPRLPVCGRARPRASACRRAALSSRRQMGRTPSRSRTRTVFGSTRTVTAPRAANQVGELSCCEGC